MTRTKAWRLSLAAILGFGWLFLTPAYSDDPLTLAAQQIQQLNNSVKDLNYQDDFIPYIAKAQLKYEIAVTAKNDMDSKIAIYDSAIQAESIALSEKNSAQLAVNNQTTIVSNAQNALDISSINLSSTQSQYPIQGTPGLNAYLYDCWNPWNIYNNAPQFGCGATPISMGPWNSMWWNFGGGGPAGLYDDYQIHLVGYIKQTQHWTPQFRTCGDDGMVIIINGITVASDWYDRGGGCGLSNGYYMPTNDWVPIEIWWYENGGGAWGEAQWNIGNGFVTIPSSVLSTEIPYIAPELVAAQQDYDNKLSIYNYENGLLTNYTQTLSAKTIAYNTAVSNTSTALTDKNNAIDIYNQSIIDLNNAINDAWKYYDEQKQREIQIAIAQALANQPQPTPEPSPEPSIEPTPEPSPEVSPEPTPEQTKPTDPTPEPTPETTPEVTPSPDPTPEISPEPTPEPSLQQTDIVVDPTPEPTSDPVVVPDKTDNSPVDAQTANLIADLTNSSTLTKLTPEQKVAVAGALGIKPAEIAIVAEIAKSNPAIAEALQEFGDRANANLNAPMPYTLADATTEVQAEKLLADPIGALTNIDLEKVLNPSEWGKDMTDDQRKKAQEVVIPVIIASNLVAAAMTRRI